MRVIYRGPFAEAADDCGNIYRRGECVTVPAERALALHYGAAADQFLFPAPAGGSGATCSVGG
jgi:hypothetical protein